MQIPGCTSVVWDAGVKTETSINRQEGSIHERAVVRRRAWRGYVVERERAGVAFIVIGTGAVVRSVLGCGSSRARLRPRLPSRPGWALPPQSVGGGRCVLVGAWTGGRLALGLQITRSGEKKSKPRASGAFCLAGMSDEGEDDHQRRDADIFGGERKIRQLPDQAASPQ